jgi:hypothetical protein
MQRLLTDSEVLERFVEDGDVIAATRSWAQGHLSDQELIDRLKYALEILEAYPVEHEPEAIEEAV